MNQLVSNAQRSLDRTAIISNGQDYSYQELLDASCQIASYLLDGRSDLQEERVAYMIQPGFDYVKVQWGIWRAGGIAVPICVSYPSASIEHVLDDAQCSTVVAQDEFLALLEPLVHQRGIRLLNTAQSAGNTGLLPQVAIERRAMILYTSGTTGKPKGVVTTHKNIEAQISTLVDAWAWSPDDHILNVLPLHHVHGIINVVSCALWSGACCQFVKKFSPETVMGNFLKGDINVFMAVPTIYHQLISHWEWLPEEQKTKISHCLKRFRLMISGSAALPVSVMNKWQEISGQTLLERYGMTEIGMAISNSYHDQRIPGHIGLPLPGVSIRLVDEENHSVQAGNSGEIQVKGNSVFKEYWNKPEVTTASFTEDGWFKTGDIAMLSDRGYRIVGRNSVDIIKSGGYKISALEIEEVLRTHTDIKDCAVVGIPDVEWEEVICAALILSGKTIDLESLKLWIRDHLPGYKVPRQYMILDDLPRNVMGKVTKNELKKLFVKKF